MLPCKDSLNLDMQKKVSIFWFRRDLRLDDNTGFLAALKAGVPVLPIFIFDQEIIEQLPKDDARVSFIYSSLQKMQRQLQQQNASLATYYGTPTAVFQQLLEDYELQQVFVNGDYEPYARKRDKEICTLLQAHRVPFNTYKDQVVFEKSEVVKKDGNPYLVYTPYKNRWKQKFNLEKDLMLQDSLKHLGNMLKNTALPFLSLSDMGFSVSPIQVPDYDLSPPLIQNYEARRNYPSIEHGTSRLGPHIRFGTVSIRTVVKKAIAEQNEVFWNELIWREFFMQVLWHFPHTVHKSFKPKYDRIVWRNQEGEFEKWKNGVTGYALVDAGMRELNATGYMHNRVRMLVASFLCKHLLIDWRWGEAYFAEKLLDYDLSANVGNWQWAAGCGVDAAPYFRIFNPMTQIEKFDKQRDYIKKWVPEWQEHTYPQKMVDHKEARERCLKVYKAALT